MVRIGNVGAHCEARSLRAYAVVGIGELALERLVLLAPKGHFDGRALAVYDVYFIEQAALPVAQHVALARLKIGLHDGAVDYRGEQRGVGGNEVAGVDHALRDLSGDGRAYVRVFEVQLGLRQTRLRVQKVCLGAQDLRVAGVVNFLGNGVGGEQPLRALEICLGEQQARLNLLDRRLGRRESRLVGARVDDEQQVALLDYLPLFKENLFEIAADARAELDKLQRLDSRGVLVPNFKGFLGRLGDQNLGSGARGIQPLLAASRK